MDLLEMDDKTRDGFLSNLSAAITNAIESIRERLPSIPNLLNNRPTEASNIIAAALAEDDKKRK